MNSIVWHQQIPFLSENSYDGSKEDPGKNDNEENSLDDQNTERRGSSNGRAISTNRAMERRTKPQDANMRSQNRNMERQNEESEPSRGNRQNRIHEKEESLLEEDDDSPQINICKRNVERSTSGFIGSPSVLSYDEPEQCHCSLTTSPYSTLTLTVLDYVSSDCDFNSLTVNTEAQSIVLCDEKAGTGTLDSRVNKLSLEYTALSDTTYEGRFWLKYEGQYKIPC